MTKLVNKSTGDLSVSAHALKSVVGIKFTRAGQRHASAMGFKSANHLLEAVKIAPVERDFDQYILILEKELLANHQVLLNAELTEVLRAKLTEQ